MRRGRRKKTNPQEPDDHALGRSRGGFSTKIHLLCDAGGCPLHFELSAGQANEITSLEDLLNGVDNELRDGTGKVVPWPHALAGDKGYRADWIDAMLLEIGVKPVIPSRVHEHHDARPVKFNKRNYRRRNIIERLIGWLKESRAVFSRFEKTAINYAGMIKMACIRRYLKILTAGV